ncbi:MAG: hypothetical protein HKN49_11730 [Gammaproteobacteria bacterium]|nr:hypothetical protein [Gammaproteobacteria bacterium]
MVNATGDPMPVDPARRLVCADTLHQGTSSFAWTLADGTVFETEKGAGVIGRLISAQYPNGLYKRVYRDSNGYITSVVQNDGYMLKFAYPSSGVTTVTAINMAVDYCPRSTLAPCAFSRSWPTATISDGNPFVVINSTGATWELQSDWNLNSSSYLTLKPFTADTSTHVYELRNYKIYNGQTWQIVANDLVYAVSTPWGDWSYGRSPNGSYNYKSNSHSPQNTVRQVDYDSNGDINRIKQPDGRMVHYHPVTGLISSSTYPSISYEYDSRGNLTRVTSGDMITQAGYPPSCPSYARKTCNKPDWVTDARGVKTAFNYVITHGGRNYMIEDSLNKRRMTAYRWVQKHAWVKNASGSYSKLDVDGPRAVWLLESVRTCRQSLMHSSGQFCHGGGDILTSYDYGSGNSSAPSNLHVRGEVVTAGGQSLRTCYKYDDLGNRISETAPRANLASCP